LILALGHAAQLGLGFLQVGLLATQMHVFGPDQLPVRVVHLILYVVYEVAQFLDMFREISQTLLHSLLQHVSESIDLVCRFATSPRDRSSVKFPNVYTDCCP